MRLLTVGLVLTITLAAFSALSVETILPIISDELGGVSLYGWVFSAFFLGSLASVIVTGGIADQRGTLVPYSVGLGATFAILWLVFTVAQWVRKASFSRR